jgi:hypothetical protein
MAARISEDALDTLFRKARSYGSFADEPVSDAQLHAIYEIMKHGPTTANSQPQRIVFLRSAEAKQRLAPALSSINREKTLAAPVVAIFAYDLKFTDHLPRFYHNKDAQKWYTKTPEHTVRPRSATPRCRRPISCSRRARSGSTAGRCRASTMPGSTRSFSPTGSGSRTSCAIWQGRCDETAAAQSAVRVRGGV